jgi:hypothetical protein
VPRPVSPAPHRRHARPALVALAAALLLAAPPARAQRIFGPGEDAYVLARGELRWGFGARWTAWDELLRSDGTRGPLNAAWTNADAGTEFFGGLAPAQASLRSALGDPTARVSIGATRLRNEYHQDRVPLTLELGVTRRVTVQVTVPLVLTYAGALFDINRANPSPANLGLNPGYNQATIGGLAASVNTQATAAVAALQAAFPSCFTATPAGGCASTIALAQNTAALGAGVVSVYGVSGRYAPLAGSPLHTALLARFTALNAQLRAALGLTSDPITTRPQPAAARMALDDFTKVLRTAPYGVLADTVTSLERTALGDVEVGARWQWLNTVEGAARDSGRANPSGLRLRSVAGLGVRLNTGARPYTGQFLDIGAGDGATGIEFRTTTDVIAGDHFWASITGRYVRFLPGDVERRLPASTAEALIPAYRRATVSRQVGDAAELLVTPRWMFNDYFALSGEYELFLQKGTRYTSASVSLTDPIGGGTALFDPALLNTGRQVAQRAGIGLAYSTVAAAARGKTRIPLDVRWQRLMTLSGEGTPFTMIDRLELRVTHRLFGHP